MRKAQLQNRFTGGGAGAPRGRNTPIEVVGVRSQADKPPLSGEGVVHTVSLEAAVGEDLPGIRVGEDVLDLGPDLLSLDPPT